MDFSDHTLEFSTGDARVGSLGYQGGYDGQQDGDKDHGEATQAARFQQDSCGILIDGFDKHRMARLPSS